MTNKETMTNKEAKDVLQEQIDRYGQEYDVEGIEALETAIKALGQISHLKDRPCEACEFYTEKGCSKWECVFEGSDKE